MVPFIIATSNFLPHSTKFTIWRIGQYMLELRQKTSEISTYEKHFQIMYIRWLKKPIQRIFKASHTGYFFSFSNFKILHQFYKTFVNPIFNRVYSPSKCHFLKSDLKNLKNLNSLKNLKIDQLQTKQTIIHTRKLQNVHKDKITLRMGRVFPSDVYNSSLQEQIFRLVQFLNLLFCRRGMPKWHSYPPNAIRAFGVDLGNAKWHSYR